MTTYSTQIIIFIIVLLGCIYTLVKHRDNKAYKNSAYLVFIFVTILLVIGSIDFSNQHDIPDQIVSDRVLSLSIVETDERSYLSNNNQEVKYISLNNTTPSKLAYWHPVYLDEIDSYYIVIFSSDKDTKVSYSRFKQKDFERYQNIDTLVIIEKSTGYIFDTTHYELIGQEIDLTSFQEGFNIVTFNVFLSYEEKVSYIRYLHIKDDYSLESTDAMYDNFENEAIIGDWLKRVAHVHTLGEPSWVEDFILFEDQYYYEDSHGIINYGYIISDRTHLEFISQINLSNETYVKQGYFKLTKDGLYFVDSYRTLCLVNYTGVNFITENIILEDWESYI